MVALLFHSVGGPHEEIQDGAIWVEYFNGIGSFFNPSDPLFPEVKRRYDKQETKHREFMQALQNELKKRIDYLK